MRQTRYAVVLNGGVSLAIWMGGVTHELNRLRLASETPPNDDVHGEPPPAWQVILDACNRTAVVDIIAGTSAGGLNGTLLATAVARGAHLPDMGHEWSTVASLSVGALTREDVGDAKSVLDGEFFTQQVERILTTIQPDGTIPPRECTLLVTATALNSQPQPTRLETGNTMFSRDGRRVFKFERRIGPASQGSAVTNDFDAGGDGVAALAQAARASASYPVAFAPVWESDALSGRAGGRAVAGRWLADGGVLDNAPFEPLLDVLRERPTNEPFERVLLYVTPGTGRAEDSSPPVDAPELTQTLGLVLSAMREPDERLDADALQQIFRRMSYAKSQAYRTIWDYLTGTQKLAATPLLEAAGKVFDGYRTTRAEGTERWLNSVSGKPQASVLAPPAEAQLCADDIPGMPGGEYPAFNGVSWEWGWSAADRILRWWGRALSKLDLDSAESVNAMEQIAAAQREVTARWGRLEAAVTGDPAAPKELDEQITAMQSVYCEGAGNLADALAAAMLSAAKAIVAAVPGAEVITLISISLAVEVISGMFSWLGSQYDTPTFRFHNVTPAVASPPGVDLGPVGDHADWPTKKLYGERLNHFGAFASPQGRRHDWLWGRLDGASELSNQLLNAAGIPKSEAERLRIALINEILQSEKVSKEEVVEAAVAVYNTSADEMLRAMAATDDGEAFRHIEATIWVLTRQFGTPGMWLRVLMAPTWSPGTESGLSFRQRVITRAARTLTAPLRRPLRSKLPYT